MRRRFRLTSFLLAAFLPLAACGEKSETILSISATGTLIGTVALDTNGNLDHEPSIDSPMEGIRVAVVRGSRDTVATAVTGRAGVVRFASLPVGSYRILIPLSALGDSLRLADPEPKSVTVVSGDSSTAVLLVGPPSVSASEARSLPPGRLVAVTGVALNGWGTYADSAVHVADATGSIRIARPRLAPVSTDDSLRVLGRTGLHLGQPALLDPILISLGRAAPAPATRVDTRLAAIADGGRLDARLVEVRDARIIDSRQTSAGDTRVTVSDGSGSLEILLERAARIVTETAPVPGAILNATGVLVPGSGGGWTLKPRRSTDVEVAIRTVRISELRTLPLGSLVAVNGVALNGREDFGDLSLHLADVSGAIRAVNLPQAFIFPGDSIRLVGTVTVRDGQPVLSNVSPTLLGSGRLPVPISVVTGSAASANQGQLDASLVRIARARVVQGPTGGGSFVLVADDGSGRLQVSFGTNWAGSRSYAIGDILDLVGVLVPTPSGAWVLRPRSPQDVAVR